MGKVVRRPGVVGDNGEGKKMRVIGIGETMDKIIVKGSQIAQR